MLMDEPFGFAAGGTGFTPRGVGLTPVAMQMTASQGGISAMVAAHDQEEERKRRTEVIVGMMGMRWGFVSQEGVERCARRLGLECLWEEGMGEERKRTLTIAGDGVLVDVEFRGEGVKGVVLQFEGSREGVVAGAGAAGKVLGRDLKGEEGVGYVLLDPFVGNLERLGTMDRLGGADVNCFDAVDGIYRSLDRVFRWETKPYDANQDDNHTNMAETICRRSGRPMMHTRGRVGLTLQYWVERRLLSSQQTTTEHTNIDTIEPTNDLDNFTIYSAIIECEASPTSLYPPIRISDAWVSETISKPKTATEDRPLEDTIDWLDPPPTYLPPRSPKENIGPLELPPNPQPRTPDIRFVAKFEPPIIVPLQTAIQIHTSVNSPLTQESLLPTTYESLVFSDTDDPNVLPTTSPRTIEEKISRYDPTSDKSSPHTHKSILQTQPNDYARAITELPFSHPRQIIALLPTLRQWALTACILRRSFIQSTSDNDPSSLSPNTTHPPIPSPPSSPPPQFQTLDDELSAFLSTPLPTSSSSTTNPATKNQTNINIHLTTTPAPHFNINFPNPKHGGKLASLNFTVGTNGTIEGVDVDDGSPPSRPQNGVVAENAVSDGGVSEKEEERGREKVKLREKIRKVLEVGESIDICVAWICG